MLGCVKCMFCSIFMKLIREDSEVLSLGDVTNHTWNNGVTSSIGFDD